ncbi:RecT-like ssDNA binding protein [Mycobacterium phage Kashi_BG2]|nr:RecT-like ssDNA binding protein [Mycobacterium phage Kashi_BG2]
MTSNTIQQIDDDGTLEVLPPARPHSSTAVAMLYEHAEVYNTAWKLAGQLVQTTMVPKRFFGRDKQGDATAAILYGAELGLNPIQSLQRVIPIHGMPSLEARTMVGLLKSHGFGFRVIEQSAEVVEVWGWEPGSPKVYGTDPADKLHYGKRINPDAESRWTIQRAITAGYVPLPSSPDSKRRPDVKEDWVTTSKTWNGKTTVSIVGNMKYITDPQTMLKAKAQAEVCRELAPDVLMGIGYTREELESEDQRQFDRMDERGAVPARVTTTRVTEDEIFAEEVPVSSDQPAGANPPSADEVRADAEPAEPAPDQPAGDVTEDRGDGAPDPQPSPAEQPETVAEPTIAVEPDTDAAVAAVKKSAADAEAAMETSKKVSAKRSTAPAANPGKPKTRMRQALEKRLFALLGDAGLSGDADRDGRIAVYRSVLENEAIGSTDDLDDPAIGKVADQLYAWQQQNKLDDKIAGILSDAARAESESVAPAADPTSEGNE